MLISMFSLGAISASANYGDDIHNADITDVIPEETNTKTFYFYMPREWRNSYNDTYDGESLDSCSAGVYWWGTSYNPEDYYGTDRNGWPGYNITETEEADSNIFVAKCPSDASTIIFNNTVDGGEITQKENDLDRFYAAENTVNITSEFYMPNEDKYGFYPDGTDDVDGMIYVCNLADTEINEFSGRSTYCGAWFYYYGNGEYGIYKDYDDAVDNNAVYSGGQWPGNNNYWTIAGNLPVLDEEWEPSLESSRLTHESEDLYSISFENVPTGEYEFLITDGSFDNTFGLGDDNFYLRVMQSCDITIEFDLTQFNKGGNGIDVYGDYVTTEPIAPGYYVTGDEGLCIRNWSNTADPDNYMYKGADGSYYADLFVLFSGEYEYKIIYVDENGKVTWHPGGMGNNSSVYVDEDYSMVRIKFTPVVDAQTESTSLQEAPESEVYEDPDDAPEIEIAKDSTKLSLGDWVSATDYEKDEDKYFTVHTFTPEESGDYRFYLHNEGSYISASLDTGFYEYHSVDNDDDYAPAVMYCYLEQGKTYRLVVRSDTMDTSVYTQYDGKSEDEESYISTFKDGDFEYGVVEEDEEVHVKSYNGTSRRVTIPSEVDRYTVTGIGSNSFSLNSSLLSVTIPDTVTVIGAWAFSDCSSLSSVKFGTGVSEIEKGAFYACSALGEVELPDSLEKVGNWAFEETDLSSVEIPKSVSEIGIAAFGFNDDEDEDIPVDGFVVKGYKDTAAEDYATDNDFEFVDLEESSTTPIATEPTTAEPTEQPATVAPTQPPTRVPIQPVTAAPTEPVETKPVPDSPTVEPTAAPVNTDKSASSTTVKKSTVKKSNPVSVTVKQKTVKAKKLKKKKLTVKAITVKNAVGKVTYKKLNGATRLKLNSKTGKITVKKGTKKGTYKIKVKITVKGNSKYQSKTITKTIRIRVK